jgi:iron complex transport system substrate-binding protein
MRIVSLLPSATEIVCALGAQAELVGVSHECDFPAGVRGLPVLTRAKVRTDATSAEIDRDVQALVTRGLSVYEIDADALAAAAPDVIVTQQQCDVCAVSYAEVVEATRRVLGGDATIVSLAPNALEDVWRDVLAVADALDRRHAGETLVARIHERLGALRAATAGRGRPVVACIEWLDPLMTAGNWMPELVEVAGGAYPFATAGAASRVLDWTALVDAQPEVAVVMPCGFGIAQSRRELGALVARPEWQALPAVRASRAWVADGNAYFNRPGPRLVESALILARLVHPEVTFDDVPGDAYEAIATA